MGIGFGFGAGPLRVYVPLVSFRSRRRRRTRRVPFWTHENCPTRHRSLEAAQACYARSEAAYQRRMAAQRKAQAAQRAALAAGPARHATPAKAAPGWYPAGEGPVLRWWDGSTWTDHRLHPDQGATTEAVGRSAPAGWYPTPAEPGVLRWWDGSTWTEHRHALPPTPGQA